MKKFKNHQCPRRKYRFDIIGHKNALKIWWDSPFKRILNKYSGEINSKIWKCTQFYSRTCLTELTVGGIIITSVESYLHYIWEWAAQGICSTSTGLNKYSCLKNYSAMYVGKVAIKKLRGSWLKKKIASIDHLCNFSNWPSAKSF
jgi:hypothetical protein